MTKTGYVLMAIGLFLLAWNYGFINFLMLSMPLVLPFVFIIAGLFSIINGILNLEDFGEFISSLLSLLLIFTIIANIFNFSSIIAFNAPVNAVIEFNSSALTASFANLIFSSRIGEATISYEYYGQLLSNSSAYSENYSATNSFSETYYDFSEFYGKSLAFSNSFGESSINNLASFDTSKIANSFGQTIIYTGKISGEKEVTIDNSFGNTEIYIDRDAAYIVESNNNAFGTIKNNVGLSSKDYSSAMNKIKIFVSNSFGTVSLYKQ